MRPRLLVTYTLITVCMVLAAHIGADNNQDTGESPREILINANQSYRDGNFKDAAQGYDLLLEQGYAHPTVWYNLGNTYAQLGETGKALVMYERALRFNTRNADLRENLALLSPPENVGKPFVLLRPFSWVLDHVTLNEFFIVANVLYVLLCLAAIGYMLKISVPLSRISRKLLKPLAVVFIIALCFSSIKYYGEIVITSGIIIEDKTIVRSGPGKEFTEIMVLPEGTRFRLLESGSEGWEKIQIPGGRTGYVPSPASMQI